MLSVFQILAKLLNVQWFLVLFCTSLMTHDVEHLFSMLICHRYVFFSDVPIKVFSPFFNLVLFLLLGFKSSLQILRNSPLSDMLFAIIFFIFYQSVDCLLILLPLPLAKQKVSILMKSGFPNFSFMDHAIGATS